MATTTAYDTHTRDELDHLARERDIDGRSSMTKDELVTALERDDVGPDAVTLLTRQHDQLRELFTRLEGRASRPSRAKLDDVRELLSTLVKHAEVEELVFYPAVREALGTAEAHAVDENLEEHHAAELLLWELERTPAEMDRYDAKVRVLRDTVLRHVEEEETELFPRVLEAIDEDRRRELGAAMVRAWDIAPSRPHPASPDTPPANWLTGPPAAVLDLAVGVVKAVKRRVLGR